MRMIILAATIVSLATGVMAQDLGGYRSPALGSSSTPSLGSSSNPNSHYVSPYTTQQGTEVQGHYQTNPNQTQRDNYGTRGNVNPYTGAAGTRDPRN